MFGLITKRAHEEALAKARADTAAEFKAQIEEITALNAESRKLIEAVRRDHEIIKAGYQEVEAINAELKHDAEKWRAKVAKDKAYEANRPKRVRKSRAKGAAA